MRLLFVSHSFPPPDAPLSNLGGMQRVALGLHHVLNEHPDLNYRALVLRSSWSEVHRRTVPFLFRTWRQLAVLAGQKAVDVVLFSSMVTAALAVPLARRFQQHGVKAAAIVHGLDVTTSFSPYQWFVPKVFDALDAVLPVSRATGAACMARGLPAEKCHVVPNGIRLDRFPPLAPRSTMRQALLAALDDPAAPLPPDALLCCSLGRHVRRKGFDWFISTVMPRLPDAVHYWLGGEGPETTAIQSAITAHGLDHRVRLLGRLSEGNLLKLYRGADLFIMPNVPVEGDMEGFGVVMLEAGLCGLPSIAADIEGILDVITDGVNGQLVASGDAQGFVDAISRYHHHRDLLDSDGPKAAQHVVDTFSWKAVGYRYATLLAHLLHDTQATQ